MYIYGTYFGVNKCIYFDKPRLQCQKANDEIKLPNESGVTICSNPRCQKKIDEPILLNCLSTKPAERYHACPHCFIKLDVETEKSQLQKEEEETEKEMPAVEPLEMDEKVAVEPLELEEEPVVKPLEREEKPAVEPLEKEKESAAKPLEKEGKGPSGCPHEFGYLAKRPKDAPIPQECLVCSRIVDCMLKPSGAQ